MKGIVQVCRNISCHIFCRTSF